MTIPKKLLVAFGDLLSSLAEDRDDLTEAVADLQQQLQPFRDGRQSAWPEERRKATGERIKALWAAKREAEKDDETYFMHTYSDEPSKQLVGRHAIAEASGLSIQLVSRKLNKEPDGFPLFAPSGRLVGVIAKSEAALIRILAWPTEQGYEALTLPSKKHKRF